MFFAKNFIHFACFNEKSEFFEIFMTASEIFVRSKENLDRQLIVQNKTFEILTSEFFCK